MPAQVTLIQQQLQHEAIRWTTVFCLIAYKKNCPLFCVIHKDRHNCLASDALFLAKCLIGKLSAITDRI